MLSDEPVCKLCHQSIVGDQVWEYSKGWYAPSTPEWKKDRVHRACVTKLAGEVSALMARVPEERR